ncbi:hypothetical protein PLESTM_000047400 [Pleodorina starrii]|nr:hypothetical protein PLESTM_000047400 [Pleodorina starrii]
MISGQATCGPVQSATTQPPSAAASRLSNHMAAQSAARPASTLQRQPPPPTQQQQQQQQSAPRAQALRQLPAGSNSASRNRALGLMAAPDDLDADADLLDGLDGPDVLDGFFGSVAERPLPVPRNATHDGVGAAEFEFGVQPQASRMPWPPSVLPPGPGPGGVSQVVGLRAQESGAVEGGGGGGGGGGGNVGRWWEDLDDLLSHSGGGEAGGHMQPPGGAGKPPAAGAGRRGAGPRQAVLTPGGGCTLPPPPVPGASWKAARPAVSEQHHPGGGGRHAPVAAAAAMSASSGERSQQQQRQAQGKPPPDGGIGAAALAGAAPAGTGAARKRARTDGEAAKAYAEVLGGLRAGGAAVADGGAEAGGSGGGKGGGAKRKDKAGGGGPAQAMWSQLLPLCESLEGATGTVREVYDPQVVSELRRDISRSRLLLAGLLMAVCEGPVSQFASNMQSLSKPQRDALLKARRVMAKDPAAAAALNAEAAEAEAAATAAAASASAAGPGSETGHGFSGVLASEHLERCVAFCVLCLDERLYDALLGGGGGTAGMRDGGGDGGDVATALADAPLYVLRITAWPPPHGARTRRGPRFAGDGGGGGGSGGHPEPLPRTALLSLLDELLVRAPCPTLCCNAKALLREALCLGWQSPPPQRLRPLDPCVLAWMDAPQLAQRDEKEIEGEWALSFRSFADAGYTLEALCPRYGILLPPPPSPGGSGATAAAAAAAGGTGTGSPTEGPLSRLRRGLLAAGRLFEAVRLRVQPWLRPQAVQVEMQVSWLLARMEAVGIAVDAAGLGRKGGAARRRMEALSAAAAELLGGRQINLGSSAQLAVVLYDELALPTPAPQGQQRDAAGGPGKDRNGRTRTHHSTDEAALKQIKHLHPLPAIVLQYRALQNVLSKWLEPEWLPPLLARSRAPATAAATAVAAAPSPPPSLPRLSCCWNQTATATGRLSSSAPNMQAVTKYEVVVQLDTAVQMAPPHLPAPRSSAGGPAAAAAGAARTPAKGDGDCDAEAEAAECGSLVVVARNAFVAPAGRLLVAADYSQIELRLLAHLSGDLRLQELLKRGGDGGGGGPDVFRQIGAAWLRPADISGQDREQVKRVIYGIIYGMTPQGLAQQLAEYGVGLEQATSLRASFLRHFAGVQAFITSSLHHARRHGYITTGLLGRRRPIAGVNSADPRVRADAERKVVNSIVQGSAADLVKCAMCMWAEFNHPHTPRQPPHAAAQAMSPPQLQPPRTAASAAAAPHPDGLAHTDLRGPASTPPAPPLNGAASAPAAPALHAQLPPLDAELVAQIHDELVFEVDSEPEVVRRLVAAVRAIMCGVVALDVPLLVKVAAGQSWGGLKELPAGFGEGS